MKLLLTLTLIVGVALGGMYIEREADVVDKVEDVAEEAVEVGEEVADGVAATIERAEDVTEQLQETIAEYKKDKAKKAESYKAPQPVKKDTVATK